MEEKIENAQGTLSVVAINHEGELLVRASAKQFEGSQTQTEMEMVPCKIVKAPNGGAWVEANGQKYSPFQIGAFLLAQMDGYAQEYRETTKRSFTVMVPACLRDAQIKVTFDIDHHNEVIVLAKNEASEKEMDLLPLKSYFLVEKWLSKYREKIPAEIVK
ncbi:PREDICTED: heat shock 70 kDa protein, mitochondrial-like [Tarenaya hassleriana]|uniref:heat shock 70 kDa protein, mitochondrial-like n=1 Tax=Tarenaya hassleriana TaxID=28532 RepID=UPI00053C7F78|nr:PREDICTED: heat shock 70 kDa protein, mitochondrial-like [Tarenaya hassleriana]